MLKIRIVTVFSFFLICFLGQAQKIEEPQIILPQYQFNAMFDGYKVLNPLNLNGDIISVKRISTEHISPLNDKEYVETHNYKLNNKRQIIEYSNDLKYKDTELKDLNLIPTLSIKNDTIIQQEHIKYTFKKGRMVLKEKQDMKYGYLDSIVFHYKNNKLIERLDFGSKAIVKANDEGVIDNSELLFGTSYTKTYQKIAYNKSNQIKSYKAFDFNLDEAETWSVTYNYNNSNNLKSFNQVSINYYKKDIDIYKHPATLVFKKEDSNAISSIEINGEYNYDEKERIVNYKITHSNKQSENYNFTYTNNGYIVEVSRVYTNFLNEIVTESFEHEYVLDSHNNPIQINSYFIENDERILNKSTTLEIIYSEK